jgi:hypothetical protein
MSGDGNTTRALINSLNQMSNNNEYTQRIFTSRKPGSAATYVGDQGQLFYHPDTGEIRISDGVTPHGHPIFTQTTSTGSVTLSLYASNGTPVTAPMAVGNNSTAMGDGAISYAAGAINQSSGVFSARGDAQTGSYIFRTITVNNSWMEMFLDGVSQRLIIPASATVSFTVKIIARRTDSGNEGGIYEIKGGVDKGTFNASIALIGKINKTVVSEDNPIWDVNVDTDTTTGALRIWVKGENGKTIRWVAHLETVEVRD